MNLITAISAIAGCKHDQPTVKTYANILLRTIPRKGAKSSPVKLSNDEALYILNVLLDGALAKWYWVVGREHSRYIYMEEKGIVKITSVSGFYSGTIKNQFNMIGTSGKSWIKVETLKAGSDWWKNPIPRYLLHDVYSFRGALPKCGPIKLPVITSTGYAWIERGQVE